MARPQILDPQAVPVVAIDEHLPPVDPSRLTAEGLRQRFVDPPPFDPEIPGDGPQGDAAQRMQTAAAVLVPIVTYADERRLLLTRRTDHLRDHAGQISFPGGRVEDSDADVEATALRETEEEVGLARSHIEVIGQLPRYMTVTGFVVTPVVALVRPGFALSLDRFEVAEAFEVPLPFLMNPAHHRRHRFEIAGQAPRHFLSMPWQGLGADGVSREYFIWGATAAMLRNFYRYLSA